MKPCRFLVPATLAVSLALFGAGAFAKSTVNTDWDGLAIGGYDPVAYFTMDRAVKGTGEFSYEYLGSEWHFANAEHLQMFKEDPLRYIPQYGGYCASAVPHGGGNSMINPRVWRMVDGKLYLFYSERQRIGWSSDTPEVVAADAAWDRVKAGLE
ncbi:MAG: hypothetical protein GTO67_04895 [Gammaproteobacteria bacterium]|nr:hypothetical protein [Gammaproteobacteria bacterium]NIM73859.1 hypothetical protein [Gammaproteobacteria bacterium]NIN38047.1 hypothetical protein [Gammaproteobacteria bacterium]NIO25640.1 hypothetical protein [Gammaproteobacteria bacterium]NIO66274.1 hypothetical protein [Gammaproteobacteria bacterium]